MLCCLSVIYSGPAVKVHTQEYSCVIEHHFCVKSVKDFCTLGTTLLCIFSTSIQVIDGTR